VRTERENDEVVYQSNGVAFATDVDGAGRRDADRKACCASSWYLQNEVNQKACDRRSP